MISELDLTSGLTFAGTLYSRFSRKVP